jgi:Tfp pilus assembly pilus retraction ATPase PilT
VTGHILTIEDPIEFLHRDKKCLVNQREIGMDAPSFGEALRSALRQDPTSSWWARCATSKPSRPRCMAAETGHLVMSTLHTLDATETINRVVAVFPPYQQKQVRLQLASVLRGILSQRLVPGRTEGARPGGRGLHRDRHGAGGDRGRGQDAQAPRRDRGGYSASTGCRRSTSH